MKKIELTEEQKINILLSALGERYNSIHIIRERVQNICIWTLGILLTAAGWLVQSSVVLGIKQKILYSFILLIAFIVVRFLYLKDLSKGFKSQQSVASRIESALSLYEKDVFVTSENSIYPKKWEQSGKEDGEGNFFGSNYYLLYVGFFILLITIWLHKSPCF